MTRPPPMQHPRISPTFRYCHRKPVTENPNHRIAKTPARVEHVFATMDQMGGRSIRTIGQARADSDFATYEGTCFTEFPSVA